MLQKYRRQLGRFHRHRRLRDSTQRRRRQHDVVQRFSVSSVSEHLCQLKKSSRMIALLGAEREDATQDSVRSSKHPSRRPQTCWRWSLLASKFGRGSSTAPEGSSILQVSARQERDRQHGVPSFFLVAIPSSRQISPFFSSFFSFLQRSRKESARPKVDGAEGRELALGTIKLLGAAKRWKIIQLWFCGLAGWASGKSE